MEWQRDDIEYAVAQYADSMSPELLATISDGREHFLRTHITFADDIDRALTRLTAML